MKKLGFLAIFSSFMIFMACSSDNTGTDKSNTSISSVQGDPNATLDGVKALMKEITANRNADGTLKQEKFPALVQQMLGLLQKNSGDFAVRDQCFDAAELLKIGKDYDNAALMYQKVIELFPKSDMVGNAQFQLAVMQEKHLKDTDAAITSYEAFVRDYPEHRANTIATQFLYKLRNGAN